MFDNATDKPLSPLRSELSLVVGAATVIFFLFFGDRLLGNLTNHLVLAVTFFLLFIVMLWLAFSVVRHADALAIILGEPYGTLILTFSVICIEVIMISAVMLTGEDSPTLARDTLFSVIMITLNGMIGITLIIGAMRHGEQDYNLKGSSAYLSVIIPLAGLGIILPRYTTSEPGGQVSPMMAVYLIVMSIILYGVFLAIQTMRHRGFFEQPKLSCDEDVQHTKASHNVLVRSLSYHAILLPLTILPIVLLSEKMAILVDHGTRYLGAPHAIGGFLVAILVLSPEGLAAIKAARANQLQRTMNIALGSALSTISLTIPAVLFISLISGEIVDLGLDTAEAHLLLITFLVSTVTLTNGKTNVLHGMVHLVLFATYVMLIFD